MTTVTPSHPRRLEAAQWRQLAAITAGALAIFFALRALPTGTNLSHMDFRVDPKAGNAIEFCDPANPQFIPVVEARSPVAMALRAAGSAPLRGAMPTLVLGREAACVVALATGSGKPIAPEDLLVVHTRPLHLLIVDPTLTDYQHVHPQPGATPGEWTFSFTPQREGVYRVFADFTPAATGRGLYASADLRVERPAPAAAAKVVEPAILRDPPQPRVERDGVVFVLATGQTPVRVRQPVDLRFTLHRTDGAPVPMAPVMGAYAHLVAFDAARSGFAHLHPTEVDPLKAPDAHHPAMNFKLTIPRAGRYVVWAQVNLGGREVFVPFALDVVE